MDSHTSGNVLERKVKQLHIHEETSETPRCTNTWFTILKRVE
jgi:hypothetical protein